MKNHSMIFDDFFKDPVKTKALVDQQEMKDVKYDLDGVVYPAVARLPESVEIEIQNNMRQIVGPRFDPVLAFARYSFKDVKPPHWAHSDNNISQFLALIYLNEDAETRNDGTVVLKHKEFKFESHPETDFHKQILLHHANSKEEWEETFRCPARFNRIFILNARLVHAAAGQYGSNRMDGRLVISVFFNLGDDI